MARTRDTLELIRWICDDPPAILFLHSGLPLPYFLQIPRLPKDCHKRLRIAGMHPRFAPFSGQSWDADPYFTKDGNILYFISNRPLKEGDPQKDFDIWKIEKKKNEWSHPIRMDSPINSETSEYYPTVADNGNLYFGSRRKAGKAHPIFMSAAS